jgi:hypothetical protein
MSRIYHAKVTRSGRLLHERAVGGRASHRRVGGALAYFSASFDTQRAGLIGGPTCGLPVESREPPGSLSNIDIRMPAIPE